MKLLIIQLMQPFGLMWAGPGGPESKHRLERPRARGWCVVSVGWAILFQVKTWPFFAMQKFHNTFEFALGSLDYLVLV